MIKKEGAPGTEGRIRELSQRREELRPVLKAALVVTLLCLVGSGQRCVPQNSGHPAETKETTVFGLPPANRITIYKPLECRAIATSFTSETTQHLETEVSTGTDHLTITRKNGRLYVTAHHDRSEISDDSEVYAITSETADFVSAVQGIKMLPVVHGLVINKRLGVAVWTEADSSFVLVSDYPVSTTVFLACRN
jgi:hypothetical protein